MVEPKLRIYSRIQNPSDFIINDETPDEITVMVHTPDNKMVPVTNSATTSLISAADQIKAVALKNMAELDKITRDLNLLNQELKAVS